jgi:hypothetical protein
MASSMPPPMEDTNGSLCLRYVVTSLLRYSLVGWLLISLPYCSPVKYFRVGGGNVLRNGTDKL